MAFEQNPEGSEEVFPMIKMRSTLEVLNRSGII